MRVVSQDLTCDVPYDSVVILISITHTNEIIAYPSMNILDRKGYWRMATYSSREKVKKAMEMLRKQFLDYACNYHSQSGVFYFPQDSEIEV